MSWPSSGMQGPSYDGIPYAPARAATLNFGPAFSGFMIQFFLYGIFMSHFFDYLSTKNYKRDSNGNRVLLWAVAVLNSFSTATNAYLTMYHGCSQDRGYGAMYQVTPADDWKDVPVGVLGFAVQTFLTLRASRLFQARPLARAAFIAVFITLTTVSASACIIGEVHAFAYYFGWVERFGVLRFNILEAVWLWLSAAVDVGLTAALILCLRRSVQGFNKQTDSAVTRVMHAALQSALPTAVFGVAGAVLNIAWGAQDNEHTIIFQICATPLASLYSLSLLTTFKSRKPIRRHKAVIGSSAWMKGSGSHASASGSAGAGDKAQLPVRPSLAARTISKMSIPSIKSINSRPALPGEGGIQFTRDVVEQVELSDEPQPRFDRPYLESYLSPSGEEGSRQS